MRVNLKSTSLARLFGSLSRIFRNDHKHHGLAATIAFCLFMIGWTGLSLCSKYLWIESINAKNNPPIDYYARTNIFLTNWTQDYIDKTKPDERLYNQLATLNPLPMPFINRYKNMAKTARWYKSNYTICDQELSFIENELKSNKLNARGFEGYELTTYLESFGHPLTGYHRAIRATWLGSRNYCSQSRLQLTDTIIKSQLCLGEFDLIVANPKKLDKLSPSKIKIGLCVPESCQMEPANHFKKRFQSIFRLNVPAKYSNNLQIKDIICLPDEKSPDSKIPLAGWLYIAFCAIWLSLVFVSSLLELYLDEDFMKKNEHTNQHLISFIKIFSLCSSMKTFLAYRTSSLSAKQTIDRPRIDFAWLDMIRIILAISVIFHHSYGVLEFYTDSLGSIAPLLSSYQYMIPIQLSMRALDIFLVMFGIFYGFKLSRSFGSERKTSFWYTWLTINIDIFLRVGPIYMFLQLYERFVSPYLGSSFRWLYASSEESCTNSSWFEFIPYFAQKFTCNSHVWYIHVYVCAGLLIPFIVYTICKLNRYSLKLAFVMFIWTMSQANLVCNFFHMSRAKLDELSFKTKSFLYDDDDARLYNYFDVLTRIGIVAFSCFIGHVLYKYQVGDIKEWPKLLVNRTTACLLFVLLLINLFVPILSHWISMGKPISRFHLIVLYLLTFGTWGLVSSVSILFLSTYGNDSILIKTFMKHPFFASFAKLTFVLYMVQNQVISYLTGQIEDELNERSHMSIGLYVNGIIFVALLVTIPIHLLFENPIQNLLSLIKFKISGKK